MNERAKYIGGSDSASVLGISPWRSPYELWLEKTGRYIEEPTEEKLAIFRRGKIMEPYVLKMLVEETGITITAKNQRYADSEHPFLACEIDAETEHENIEIKTVSHFGAHHWGEPGTDEIPVWYTAQVLHGLMITGRDSCIVGALIGSDDLRIHRVERDDEAIAMLREREVRFWNENVLADVEPELVSLSDVHKRFSRDMGSEIYADENTITAALELKEYAKRKKLMDEQMDRLKMAIQLYMGNNAVLLGDSGQKLATWKTQTSTILDQKGFKTAHPELAEQFKRTNETRVFRIA